MSNLIQEAKKSLTCLAITVPEDVYVDIQRRFGPIIARAEAWEMTHGAQKPQTYDQHDRTLVEAHDLVVAADKETQNDGR